MPDSSAPLLSLARLPPEPWPSPSARRRRSGTGTRPRGHRRAELAVLRPVLSLAGPRRPRLSFVGPPRASPPLLFNGGELPVGPRPSSPLRPNAVAALGPRRPAHHPCACSPPPLPSGPRLRPCRPAVLPAAGPARDGSSRRCSRSFPEPLRRGSPEPFHRGRRPRSPTAGAPPLGVLVREQHVPQTRGPQQIRLGTNLISQTS